jgi:endonuclease YncB( thermonuclease family)
MVRIAHHHRDRFPATELLHRVELHAGLDQQCGPRVPQVMKAECLDCRRSSGPVEGAEQIPCITVLHNGPGEKVRLYGIDCPKAGVAETTNRSGERETVTLFFPKLH